MFDAAKLWGFMMNGKQYGCFYFRLLRHGAIYATKVEKGVKMCRKKGEKSVFWGLLFDFYGDICTNDHDFKQINLKSV